MGGGGTTHSAWVTGVQFGIHWQSLCLRWWLHDTASWWWRTHWRFNLQSHRLAVPEKHVLDVRFSRLSQQLQYFCTLQQELPKTVRWSPSIPPPFLEGILGRRHFCISQVFQQKAVTSIWVSFFWGYRCALGGSGSCRKKALFSSQAFCPPWGFVPPPPSCRYCIWEMLDESLRGCLTFFLEDPNLPKLRSLDSSCPIFPKR